MTSKKEVSTFEICGQIIASGQRCDFELPVTELHTHAPLTMPISVVNGRKPGPVLFVSAAVHGDEINGVEIIRRLLAAPALKRMSGTLIAVPIVNVQGFLAHSRYLPDRRDLNRSFPGSAKGSVAGRLAYLFATEIIAKADCGVDLHTAAIHRDNLPQVRANLADAETAKLAKAFAAPLMLNANLRDGSMRDYANDHGVPMLLYEAGEALRFDETSIRIGVNGVLNVMRILGMLRGKPKTPKHPVIRSDSSSWVRAPQAGILRAAVDLGAKVEKGQVLGRIGGPLGGNENDVISKYAGIVIGRLHLPLVNEGDALFHIARTGDADDGMTGREELLAASEQLDIPNTEPPIL